VRVVWLKGPQAYGRTAADDAGFEAACKLMIAAVANAVYDATSVRIRRIPFRPERVLAALRAARV
jgi:CO/xanthine dehydrogenase Mo-binding subunit